MNAVVNEAGAVGAASPKISWDGKVHSYRPLPDWRDRVSPRLRFHEEAADDLDPVTYEVIRHRLWMINMAHGETITRVSGSPMLSSLDFNMSILTEDAELLLSAPYVQYLNTPAPLGIRYIMEKYSDQPGIEDGDVYCGNDPWIGACHQMDVLIACPIFVDGQLFAWAANAGHQYDMGGVVPGGWPQKAEDVFSDPVCLPPFKLVEKGVMRKDLEAMYVRQSRMPDLVALDLRAQLAGVNFAREQIVDMCRQFGAATVKAAMRRILAHSQRAFQEKLRRIPDGTWSEVRYLDEALPGDRRTYRTQLNITKKGDQLIIDNKGTDPQTIGTNGITYASWSGSILGTFAVTTIYEQLFAVGGAARQIDYQPEPGLLTCVDFPAEASGGIMQVVTLGGAAQTLIARMLGTDPQLKQDAVASGPDFQLPVLTGYNDRGAYFGQALLEGMGGGSGARSYRDGVETSGPCYSPLSMVTNVETVEQWYPILYLYRYEGCDGGGAGKWRGGTGTVVAITQYRARSIEVITNTSGQSVSTHNAMGINGGYPSPAAHYRVLKDTNLLELFRQKRMPGRADELAAREDFRLRAKSNGTPIGPGDVVELRTVGGGGYGDPIEREPARVATDVRNGYVSSAVAHEVYGVALDAAGKVDDEGSVARRRRILAERAVWRPATSIAGTAEAIASTPAVPPSGEPPRAIHEYVVARDAKGRRELACARCDHELGSYGGNYKHHLLVDEGPLTLIPTNQDPAVFLDDQMVFRRYCCPGCQVLMAMEVARSGDPVRPEVLLDAGPAQMNR